jgi:4-amino-4-deoxy-L-arabinose transferase-like glycosyltransferase
MVSRPIRSDARGLMDEAEAWLDQGIREFRSYMASPQGREIRKRVAQGLILGAPLLFRTRFIRRHPVGRVLGLVGGATLVVKLAEALRDWEPLEELAEDLGLKEEDDLE